MTSKGPYTEAYVWIWLPGQTEPVVAGKLTAHGDRLLFNYGRSYLARDDAIAIYHPELPLQPGIMEPRVGHRMHGCIRDASPDAWGRRVILNATLGRRGAATDSDQLDELTYLMESGSDRIGALDFQASPTEYIPRAAGNATLEELMASAERVEKGLPLSPELDQALRHGTSIGGARPKAQVQDRDKRYVAKFASSTDLYSVVKAEYLAMRLAYFAGLEVASVSLTRAMRKDVLLIERFDREPAGTGWQRRAMVSGLTLLSLDEMMARYAGYEDLAELIRHRFRDARATLRELFLRMLFNVLCGNTDDHARNHAAFWDGEALTLTPAYDICPQTRTGFEATQAMLISGNDRMSRISSCLRAAPQFLLSTQQATDLAEALLTAVITHWNAVCDQAELSPVDRRHLLGTRPPGSDEPAPRGRQDR